MKRWIPNPCEECEEHGESVEIFTDAEQTIPGGACAYDGDECRCSEGCKGWMTADEETFYCNWIYDEDDVANAGETGGKEEGR